MNIDFLKDIGSLLSRKKDKQDEYAADEEEAEAEQPKKKKEAETDVLSMKEGDYGLIYGIKKKYVKYLCYAVACLVGIAFFYNIGNKMGDNTNNSAIRQESVADVNDSKREMSAEALNSINNSVKNGNVPGKPQNGQNSPDVARRNQVNNSNVPQIPNTNNQQQQQGQYRPQQVMPFGGYGNQYTLPSMIAAAQNNTEKAEEDSMAKRVQDSLRSAIAFFNGADGMSGSGGGVGNGAVANTAADNSAPAVQPSYTYTAPSPYLLQAGTCIPAMLMSSINSDIEGIVAAQVICDIYDTATGYNLLIPAGSRLVGSYQAKESGGRVAVTFTELILPSGASYSIGDGLVAIDSYGYMGLTGKVNHHSNAKLAAAGAGAAIAAISSAAFGNTNNNNNNYSIGQLAQQGAMASIMENVSDMFNQQVNVADTVTVQAGTAFNIFVSKGLVFNGY
ncbi:hypothetical protein NZ47_07345 [Anaerovibrio lipolyticus]|uniref:Conjugal transfer protein TrbI n=1 Tax=Anaerovibrio lipolyticus TaxID=82374 RepID=A0A0B2JUI2_9FIRM|nr:TrbI/VirB10 family protein [Anaerovibrio lipolyticus]KHM52005.1 hypothetical protein NZ47_07345 [Anaerovibrio lipolyticus]